MTAVFLALVRLLLTLLAGWIHGLAAIISLLRGRLANALARCRLPGRAAKGADSQCIPIRHPSYRKPDPLIYDQYFLMSLGLAVTWDNPDIELHRGGVPVPSSEILPDTDYEIVARIWNGSTDAPVVNLPVYFSYLEFGIGTTSHKIDGGKPTHVDLGVKGGANCPAFAKKAWRTPSLPGHYCLQVFLDWLDDANPLNNLGQENLRIGATHSPAQFTFTLRNDGQERREFRFDADTYRLPEPPPCSEVKRPTQRDMSTRAVQPAAYRLMPVLDPQVRARHNRNAYQLGEGWHVAIDPAAPVLDAGEQRTIQVAVIPPKGFIGKQPVNIRALQGDVSTGGVTLVVVVGS
ncbi:MAG TPA: hypothetical protein VGW57_09820 [Chthoniobacterales bacterium]|nr:hypothetical protein [Chthoniobacterales bacterium]